MGLVEFLAPAPDGDTEKFFQWRGSYDITIDAVIDGRTVASTVASRIFPAQTVTETDLRPHAGARPYSELYGELQMPAHLAGRRPAVLMVGGSEGGDSMYLAAAGLAAAGYPTLSLAYFKEPGLHDRLANVPLEYFAKALRYLRAQPGVDPDHVLISGASRGGEVALLVASRFPDLVHGVIATVPSSVVNGAYPVQNIKDAAWTIAGKAVPFAPPSDWNKAHPADTRAIIPVERIRGPVLLTCGKQDPIWASCAFVDAITDRLHAHRFGFTIVTRHYAHVGHKGASGLSPFYPFTSPVATHDGATFAATQAALADFYTTRLAFLASIRG